MNPLWCGYLCFIFFKLFVQSYTRPPAAWWDTDAWACAVCGSSCPSRFILIFFSCRSLHMKTEWRLGDYTQDSHWGAAGIIKTNLIIIIMYLYYIKRAFYQFSDVSADSSVIHKQLEGSWRCRMESQLCTILTFRNFFWHFSWVTSVRVKSSQDFIVIAAI